MKITNGFQGLVWQVPLRDNLGFAYVQTIDPNPLGHISASFLLKILDYHSESPILNFDVDVFQKFDMLTSHLLAMGTPPQRTGEAKWKAVGYLPLTPIDHIFPEFKGLDHQSDLPFSYTEIPQGKEWMVFWGGAGCDHYSTYGTYNQTKHLGWLTHFNIAFVHHRITMEWMRKWGMNYNQYYTRQWSEEFLAGQKYQVMTTVLFDDVDPKIRGKAIGSFDK